MLLKIHRKKKKNVEAQPTSNYPRKIHDFFPISRPGALDQCSSIEYNSAIGYSKNFFQSFPIKTVAIYPCIWEREKGNIQTSQELLDIGSEMT